MVALIDKADHFVNAVEEAQTERLEFEGDVDLPFVCVITEATAGFDAPSPLVGGGNDFALPDVFTEHEQNIFCAPRLGEVDVFPAAFDMELAHRFVKINQANGNDRQRNNRQIQFVAGVAYEADFLPRDAHGFGEDIDAIKANAFDVPESDGRVHADLLEGAVDDAEFHDGSLSDIPKP
jgi:hypothetical protein